MSKKNVWCILSIKSCDFVCGHLKCIVLLPKLKFSNEFLLICIVTVMSFKYNLAKFLLDCYLHVIHLFLLST